MRAFAIRRFGEPGSVEELPRPDVQAGEVLVRVRAAGVNAIDPIVVRGVLQAMLEHRLPLIPGVDLAGTVEAVGPAVTGLRVGDEVFGRSTKPYYGGGTFAEYASTPMTEIALKPPTVSVTDAAAIGLAGSTALALVEAVAPATGESVLIIGAGGGVGSFATQLVARTGAQVIGVTNPGALAQVRGLGATRVIDYAPGDVADQVTRLKPDGVDALIDLHSDHDTLIGLLSVVRRGGRVVSPLRAVDVEALAAHGLTGGNVAAASGRLGELGELVAAGRLRVSVSRTFSLDEGNDALAQQATGQARGKLVIVVDRTAAAP
ncbi:MAG: NADP-dependent oxidoreductase [Candidatus Limnocylindrales bacterium]